MNYLDNFNFQGIPVSMKCIEDEKIGFVTLTAQKKERSIGIATLNNDVDLAKEVISTRFDLNSAVTERGGAVFGERTAFCLASDPKSDTV